MTLGHRDRVGDLDPGLTKVCDLCSHVIYVEGEMLAKVRGSRGFDQVDLLSSGVQPGSAESEIWTVAALTQAQDLCVELQRGVDIWHID